MKVDEDRKRGRQDSDHLHEVLRRWNPWWDGAPFDSGIEREALADVCTWLGQTQVLAICGMRRCGKTTLMRQVVRHLLETKTATADEILFVNLEEPLFLESRATARVLDQLLDAHRERLQPARKPWLFLDEVQNIDGWARWVRTAAETGRANFVVSGSSSRLLEPDLATVLTGRSITHTLWPLSFREFLEFRRGREAEPFTSTNITNRLPEFLRDGGLPEVVLDENRSRREERLKQYFRDILHRDVVSRHAVRSVRALEEVAHHYLVNTARESSINSIKKKYGLAIDQVRSYTEYLVECYLIGTLPRFSFKATVQARSPRKVYARDVGVRNAVAFRFSRDLGHLAETAVFNQLDRVPDTRLFYFYDTKDRAECDFVVWRGERPERAIQVCFTADDSLPPREQRGLLAAMDRLDIDTGLLITGKQEPGTHVVDGRTIHEVPLWDWLSRRGAEG
jgi:uncharacterized protein